MNIEQLMERLVRCGLNVILKVDEERFAESGDYWTMVLSGAALGDRGYVRAETSSYRSCVQLVLSRLRDGSPEWEWTKDLAL